MSYTYNPKTQDVPNQPNQKVNVINKASISVDGTPGTVTPMIGRSGYTKDVDPELVEEFLRGAKNAIMSLHEFCQKQKLKVQFKECHAPQVNAGMVYYTGSFACKAIVNGIEHEPGKGKTKKDAKAEAAKIAFANLIGLERQDHRAPAPVHSFFPEDSHLPAQGMEQPQAGFTSGSHFQLGFDEAAPTLTSKDAWNLPDHGTYAAYQEEMNRPPQPVSAPQSVVCGDEEFIPRVPPQPPQAPQVYPAPPQPPQVYSAPQQIPQSYSLPQQPPSEEDFPSLQAARPTGGKGAWGKGPPQINNNTTKQSNTSQQKDQQQYPANHQTPSAYLQHRAQTQRHTYGAVPRQPFPQQYGPHGDAQSFGQPMRPQGMPTVPAPSPPRGIHQNPPRGHYQAPPTAQHSPQQGPYSTTDADWANRIREAVLQISPSQAPFPGSDGILNNKSLAAFLVSQDDEYQVVSLGTGEGVVSPPGLTKDGRCLVDGSGLTVARRGFHRYLYRELKHFLDGLPSVFIKSQSFIISLREGVKFHIYMNAAPNGDASRFLPEDHDTELISERDLLLMTEGGHYPDIAIDSSNGCLTTLSSKGEIQEVYTKPAAKSLEEIHQQGAVRVMSASDKLMRWNTLGVQGALLGHIIQPIYISTLVLGSGFNHGHLSRAVAARIDKAIFDNLSSYDLKYPKIGRTSRRVPIEADSQTKISINWSLGDKAYEVVDTNTGRTADSSPFKSGQTKASRVCKASFLSRFRVMCNKVKRPDLLEHSSYSELKLQNRNYNSAKRMLLRHLKLKGYGDWSKIPQEIGSFNK